MGSVRVESDGHHEGNPRMYELIENAPKEATVRILEYKDMAPFFIKGENDEPA